MKKIIAVLTVATLSLGLVACSAQAPKTTSTPDATPQTSDVAPSETPTVSNKITKAKFDQIKNGMTYKQVCEIIGSEGELLSETGAEGDKYYTVMYSWSGEEIMSSANAMFQGGKLQSKSQMGLK